MWFEGAAVGPPGVFGCVADGWLVVGAGGVGAVGGGGCAAFVAGLAEDVAACGEVAGGAAALGTGHDLLSEHSVLTDFSRESLQDVLPGLGGEFIPELSTVLRQLDGV